jgi:hypothetical protein
VPSDTTVSGRPSSRMLEFSSHAQARERGVGNERQALARVVHDGDEPDAAAVRDRGGEEIEAPTRNGPIRYEHGSARVQCPFAAAAPAKLSDSPRASISTLLVRLGRLPVSLSIQQEIGSASYGLDDRRQSVLP